MSRQSFLNERFNALLITPDDITSISSPVKGSELNKKALQLWALLQSADYDPKALSNELYNIIFKPLEGRLPKDTKTIMWSLDGDLRYLPMAALFDGKHYLVERFTQVLFTRADKEHLTFPVSGRWIGYGFATSAPHRVELFGNSLTFGALDFGGEELEIFRTKTNPNGIIDGDVISEAQFTACETAAQRPDANGKEVDGFAELAQRLGAGSVLASLWSVSDRSTAELMKAFYKNQQRGKYTKAEALRQAQLDLLYAKNSTASASNITSSATRGKKTLEEEIVVPPKYRIPFQADKKRKFAHPYYWAPFVLFGNWK